MLLLSTPSWIIPNPYKAPVLSTQTSFPPLAFTLPFVDLIQARLSILRTFMLNSSYAIHTLPSFLSKLFNNAICSGFPRSWTTNIIHPIFKFGDLIEPNNYCIIMTSYTLAKLYAMVLEGYISWMADMKGFQAAS